MTSHIWLARCIAWPWVRRLPRTQRDDIHSAALVGLVQAAGRYQPRLGVTFSTYATERIRGAVLDELRRFDMLKRRGRAVDRRLRAAEQALEHSLGREPSDEELAAHLGMDVEDCRDKRTWLQSVALADFVEPASVSSDLPALIDLREAMQRLPARESRVVALFYFAEMTEVAIGQLLGVTGSRVSQLLTRALRLLRGWMDPADPGDGEAVAPAGARG